MEKLKVGISIGDLNGIGLEVVLKTIQHPIVRKNCTPIIYGSSKVVSFHHKRTVGGEFKPHIIKLGEHKFNPNKINVVNCWQDNVNVDWGKATKESGMYAHMALEGVMQDLQEGHIDVLVTAPINKEAMKLGGFPFPGHTEYIEQKDGGKSLMLMLNDTLRVGLVTNHLPIQEVASNIDKKLILSKIRTIDKTLRIDFGVEKPTIAVLGLNPHAGDGGVLGSEEKEIIRPAIIEAKKKGVLAMGPFSADGFFGKGEYIKYDAVLAMYHDQGLVPFKALSFGNGVNYTAGLKVVRTSPDHGTAYDLAGKKEADPSSFRNALFQAIDIHRNRSKYYEMHKDVVRKTQLSDEEATAGVERFD